MPTTVDMNRPSHLNLLLQQPSRSWTDDLPVCRLSGVGYSTNQIYREDGYRREEHAFEDRSFHFKHDNETYFYGVFDGHNGSHAADFAAQRFPAEILLGQLDGKERDEDIKEVLQQAFMSVEKGFFETIDETLLEKVTLQMQLQGLNEYDAFVRFSEQVGRLQEVTNEISAGTTAVVALVRQDKLYIANVGNSRALLCKSDDHGALKVVQLSVDHNLRNDDELLRLSQLMIDVEQLRKHNQVGNQTNTRCIGNHSVKGGYKETVGLSNSLDEPVIAEPEICGGICIDRSCKFLMLMSDGLYTSLEEATGVEDMNSEIAKMVIEQFAVQSTLTGVAQAVVDKVVRIHHDTYMSGTENAKYCPKRDDITLLIRNFSQPIPNAPTNSPMRGRPSDPQIKPPALGNFSTQGSEDGNTISEESIARSEAQSRDVKESSSTETGNRRVLFEPTHSKSMTLDENERIKPYVDFTDYFKMAKEAQDKGLLDDSIIL